MSDLKTIPTEGKIKRIAKGGIILTTLAWFATTFAVLIGSTELINGVKVFIPLMDQSQADLVGVTFDRWWIAVGSFMAILAANDNGVKRSTVLLNKP
jgi:hypothetical protein